MNVCPPERRNTFLAKSSSEPFVIPTAHRKETPSNMMNKPEENPFITSLSVALMKLAKIVTAKIAIKPTFILRKKPIKIAAIKTAREINAMFIVHSSHKCRLVNNKYQDFCGRGIKS